MDLDLLTAIAKFFSASCWLARKRYSGLAWHRRAQICGLVLVAFFAAGHSGNAAAQGRDPAALIKPATNTWPTYNGDYSGARYSSLDQINASNVNSLTLAWIFRTPGNVLKSTPLEVNGILYFTAPDNVWAVDARYGREIWHYRRVSEGDHVRHRGVGMYKKCLYFTTPGA